MNNLSVLNEAKVSYFNISTPEVHSSIVNLVIISFNQTYYVKLLLSKFIFIETVKFTLFSDLISGNLFISWFKYGLSSILKDEVDINDLNGIGVTNIETRIANTQVFI